VFARDHAPALGEIRESLQREIDDAGPAALAALGYRLSHAGTEHLAGVAGKPLVIVANHLSYSDANLLEVLLHQAGAGALADRLTVIAGPKVYSSLRRRFSSLCFGTIKVPQSSRLSTDEAVMNPRDVALAARRVIEIAHERLRLGEALLIFAEGTRSRSGEMQRLLPGVARYIDWPGTWILPVRNRWERGAVSDQRRLAESRSGFSAGRSAHSGHAPSQAHPRQPAADDGRHRPRHRRPPPAGIPRRVR
jgi:acyltransferase-like protein